MFYVHDYFCLRSATPRIAVVYMRLCPCSLCIIYIYLYIVGPDLLQFYLCKHSYSECID